MRTKIVACGLRVALLCIAFGVTQGAAQEKTHRSTLAKTAATDVIRHAALLNLNSLSSWLLADGRGGPSPKMNGAVFFHHGKVHVVYSDGIIFGARAFTDSAKTQPAPFNQPIRVTGGMYSRTSMEVGRVIGFGADAVPADPTATDARIYRIRRDYFTLSQDELRRDAAMIYETTPDSVTASQIQEIRDRYAQDWQEWPVQFGAPFIDRNGNGVYDPPPAFSASFKVEDLIAGGYDEPGIAPADPNQPADQVLWTVCNDLDPEKSVRYTASLPLGLEIQITQWAFKNDVGWADYFYKRIRFINKGGVAVNESGDKGAFWLDEMYFSLYPDPDLGNYSDDLQGCDPQLNLAYAYNGSALDSDFGKYNLSPASIGASIMQGPRVPAPGETARFAGRIIHGWKNLPMTSFTPNSSGDPIADPAGEYETNALMWWKILRGFMPIQGPDDLYPFPPGMEPNRFPFSGDPLTRTGHIDGLGEVYSLAPGDRRFQISSGPFSMAPGDTQEVVVAYIAGQGSDRLASITVMKHVTRQLLLHYPAPYPLEVQTDAETVAVSPPTDYVLAPNYPNPFNAGTRIDYTLPLAVDVKLAIYDVLGREVVVLEEKPKEAGVYSINWDGRDAAGRRVPAGVYIYRLQAGHVALSRKLVVVR